MASDKKKPVFEKKAWPLSVVIFEHPGDEGRVNFSVRVTKTFKRGDDAEWETTEWLSGDELLIAAELYRSAWNWIQNREQVRHQRAREDRQPVSADQF